MLVIHFWPQMVQETIPAPLTVTVVAQHVDVVHSGLRKCLEAAALLYSTSTTMTSASTCECPWVWQTACSPNPHVELLFRRE